MPPIPAPAVPAASSRITERRNTLKWLPMFTTGGGATVLVPQTAKWYDDFSAVLRPTMNSETLLLSVQVRPYPPVRFAALGWATSWGTFGVHTHLRGEKLAAELRAHFPGAGCAAKRCPKSVTGTCRDLMYCTTHLTSVASAQRTPNQRLDHVFVCAPLHALDPPTGPRWVHCWMAATLQRPTLEG